MSQLLAKLKKIPGLLPSQQTCLERLIFQLEFNPYQLIHLVGGAGSGKSTLSLAVADLLSGEFNLALINAEPDISIERVRQHLLEHWFGVCKDARGSLLQLIGERPLHEPLALVIDQAENLPAELWQELAEIPCLVIAATEQPSQQAELNLMIPALSLADAEMLLQEQQLNTLTVADRLDKAQGNLHVLLDPTMKPVVKAHRQIPEKASLALPLSVFFVGLISIGAVVVFWLWTEQQQQSPGLGQLTYLPEEQEVRTAELAPPQPPASRVVVEKLVGNLETVGSKTETSKATGLAKPVDFSSQEAINSTPSVTAEAPTPEPTLPEPSNTTTTATSPLEPEVVASSPAEASTTPVPEVLETEQVVPQTQLPPEQELDLVAEAQAEINAIQPTLQPALKEFLFDEQALLGLPKSAVALQLVVFSSQNAYSAFKTAYPNLELYAYQRIKNNQRQYVVVLAPFADPLEAKASISKLPAALRQSFVKPMADIHAEINGQ